MKVLVSGSSGFLGSWIVRVLSEHHEIYALTRIDSNLRNLDGIRNIHIAKIDSRRWPDYVRDVSPEALIVNDWWGVENAYRNDLRQLENVERISKFVRAGLDVQVNTVIGIGSQAELGPINFDISEKSKDGPTTLYGQAKVILRTTLEEMCLNQNTRFVWMRAFSTYGPLDTGSWLIPNIIDSLSNDKAIKMTKGEQEWSYLHAYDFALAFAVVLENSNIHGTVNVGNPITMRIRDVALFIGEMLGKIDLLDFGSLSYRPDQVMKLKPLCETLIKYGWEPQISFQEGIKQTIDWLVGKKVAPILAQNGSDLEFNLPVRL